MGYAFLKGFRTRADRHFMHLTLQDILLIGGRTPRRYLVSASARSAGRLPCSFSVCGNQEFELSSLPRLCFWEFEGGDLCNECSRTPHAAPTASQPY
jgi:hypothetical protein